MARRDWVRKCFFLGYNPKNIDLPPNVGGKIAKNRLYAQTYMEDMEPGTFLRFT